MKQDLAQKLLTATNVDKSMAAFQRRTGKPPSIGDGPLKDGPLKSLKITWVRLSQLMMQGHVEGIDAETSLADYKTSKGIVTQIGAARAIETVKARDVVATVAAHLLAEKQRPMLTDDTIRHGPYAGTVQWGSLANLIRYSKTEGFGTKIELLKITDLVVAAFKEAGALFGDGNGSHRRMDKMTLPKKFGKKEEEALVKKVSNWVKQGITEPPRAAPVIEADAVYAQMLRGAFNVAACSDPATQIGAHTVAEINAAIQARTFKGAGKYMDVKKLTCLLDFAIAASLITDAEAAPATQPYVGGTSPISRYKL